MEPSSHVHVPALTRFVVGTCFDSDTHRRTASKLLQARSRGILFTSTLTVPYMDRALLEFIF